MVFLVNFTNDIQNKERGGKNPSSSSGYNLSLFFCTCLLRRPIASYLLLKSSQCLKTLS